MGGQAKLKILHVAETLSSRFGGPVAVVVSLAEAQCRAGHQVTIVTTNADHPRGVYRAAGWDALEGTDVRVFYAPVEFAPLRVSLRLAGYLKQHAREADLVHIHGLYRFPQTYAAHVARSQQVPYIITPHGALDSYIYRNSSAGSVTLKRLYERWFDLPNLHAAGAIHYTAEAERAGATFLRLRAPTFVLPNGVSWDRYSDLTARGGLRARLGLQEEPIVLFVGRLHPVKGLDLLIPAFGALRARVPNSHLVIAGPEVGQFGRQVREWVAECNLRDSVHFLGHLQGSDMMQAYVDADVLTLPSYTENFGMTAVEAMACRLPVVVSDQVKIHREISHAGAGLVTACDSGELAIALETLLRDRDRRVAMGAAGRCLIQQRYTWPGIVASMTEEYQNVIDRQSKARHLRSHIT
jgi:glycosyltransferase involved in cell wall biosynthesis